MAQINGASPPTSNGVVFPSARPVSSTPPPVHAQHQQPITTPINRNLDPHPTSGPSQPNFQTPSAPTQPASILPANGSSTTNAAATQPEPTDPRPRDARQIHMLLSNVGVSSYAERVPLQLLDFAYRYTASVLSDAQHLVAEGYTAAQHHGSTGGGRGKGQHTDKDGDLNLGAVRLAAASRPGFPGTVATSGSGTGVMSKEGMMELAGDRNRVKLPDVGMEGVKFGLKLPKEQFVMSGMGWRVPEEWEDEMDEDEETVGGGSGGEDGEKKGNGIEASASKEDEEDEDEDEEMADDDDEGEGRYEDVFGADDDRDNKGSRRGEGEQEPLLFVGGEPPR